MAHKTYLVGGAVRDMLMGATEVNDRDYVVVGATEQDMLDRGFTNVGESFPVFLDENGDQWALARRERKTGNGYQGFTVDAAPTVTIEEDLLRRDLTINAIAKDLETGFIVDPFNGSQDIEDKILRHVSPAFAEDPLRVVRLARFSARWMDFSIAAETIELCTKLVVNGELNHLSDERFYAEMVKTFKQSGKHAGEFFEFLDCIDAFEHVKFFRELFGEVNRDILNTMTEAVHGIHAMRVDEHTATMLFLGMFSRADQVKSAAIPTNVKDLVQNVRALRKMSTVTVDAMFELISRNRSFVASDLPQRMKDLMLTMAVSTHTDMKFALDMHVLAKCIIWASAVTAADFPGVEGKQLGEAIASARKNRIADVLAAPNDDKWYKV